VIWEAIIDGGSDNLTPTKEKKRHPVWDIPGIPVPTDKDLKWWDKQQKKSSKTKFKSCYHTIKKGQIWRLAKLMESREDKYFSDCQFDYGLITRWDPSYAVTKHHDKSEYDIYLKILFCGGMSAWSYQALQECAKNKQWSLLKSLSEYTPLKILPYLEKDEEGQRDTIKEIIEKTGHNEEIIARYAMTNPDPELLTLALKFTPYSKNEELYKDVLKQSDEIFYILCLAKYEHEQNGGRAYPIPIADQYIEKNIGKIQPSKSSDETAEWQAHGDTAIYRNHPVEENGTRLRDHFDFAAGKVMRVQEMPDGAYNHILSWDMLEVVGTLAMDTAIQKLQEAGGHPENLDTWSVKSQKNGRSAMPQGRTSP